MGQKVNPHGLRVGVIKDWDSRWYAGKKEFGATLVEDYNLRKTLKKQLYNFGISKIEIERDGKKVRISIHTAKPGLVIGKGGAEIEKLRATVEKMIGKSVALSIVEVRTPDTNAQLVAENNHDMDVSRLYVAECNATAGPILKRIRPRAQGRAFRINKRTSHITLVLKEKED